MSAAACGGGGGTPTEDDLCAEDGLYGDFFDKELECSPLAQILFGDEFTRADASTACYGALGPYLDDGTEVIGDGDAFDACRDWLATATCDDFAARGDDNPCDDVLVGTVEAGGLCDTSEQCAGEAYCDQPDAEACGSCTALKENDAPCGGDEECLSERCDDTNVCADLAADGDPCVVDDDCVGVLICNANMECDTEPTWAVGSPCDDILNDCGFGETDLYCNQSAGQCAEFRALGEACGASDNGSVCEVFQYRSCQEVPAASGNYECVEPTIVGEGDECAFGDGNQCDTGLRCEDHDGDVQTPEQCIVPLGDGDACDPANNLCDLFLNCVDGACQYGEYTGMCPVPPAA
ncbi:MAG TPA: hypothetical protein VL172_16320 [Kofleriaceae bacterium]|nr:hypothetical protein [Kofleriaceae bacterium]